MKLVDEINKLAIPRIANASSKKLKSDCPSCGIKLPTYQGRYPKNCPGCDCEIGEVLQGKTPDEQLDTILNRLGDVVSDLGRISKKDFSPALRKKLNTNQSKLDKIIDDISSEF